MTEAHTARELWEQYQVAGEVVRYWHSLAEKGNETAVRRLIFALFRQYLILQQILGLDAQKGNAK